MSSHSVALALNVFHRSIVKIVLELLKMDVREDMSAAIITAIMRPRRPVAQKHFILSQVAYFIPDDTQCKEQFVLPAGKSSITNLA